MSQPAGVLDAEKFLEAFYAKAPEEGAKPDGNTEEAPPEKVEGDESAAGKEEPAEQPEEEKAEPAPVEEDWKHKYDVLNGKFKKEVPVLHGKVRDLEAKLQVIEAAQAAPQTKKEEAKSDKAKLELTAALEKLKEEYGQEFVDHQRLVSRMEAESVIDERMNSLSERIDGVSNVSQQLAEERYLNDLTNRAPHWSETKDDPDFHSWLAEVDEFSGKRRFDLAKEAMMAGDSARVAAFYNTFKPKEEKKEAPAAPKKPAGDKNKFVAPSSMPSGSAQRVESEEGQAIKSSDLTTFARDVIAKKYVGREAEQKALQAKYDAAVMAGNIVMD